MEGNKVDDYSHYDQTKRQTINPMVDEFNKQTESLLKIAIKEFGLKIPLAFRLYNQIRFYETSGKLKMGTSVASKDSFAKQFGVSSKQIEDAFNNLTNKYKLGKWVSHDEPVFRNVKRTWMSNIRLENGITTEYQKYYSVIPKVLQRNTKSITAYQLAPEVRPLSESNKKVSEIYISNDIVQTIGRVYDLYIKLFNKNPSYYKLTDKRKQKIKARLKDAGEAMLLRAIENVSQSPFHTGDNDRGWTADLDFIIRSYEQVEKFGSEVTPKQTFNIKEYV